MTEQSQIYDLGTKQPRLPANGEYWIAPGAVVIGDVELKTNASVWFGAVLRGDNEPIQIGRSSNVQDGAILHADPGYPLTVGDRVTIGHRAVLHGCTVGEASLIGIGAVVMNGAVIGKNSLVGAGTLVAERKTFPDGVLILGTPARVLRPLTAAEIEGLEANAAHYVENWKRYAGALTPGPTAGAPAGRPRPPG